MNINDIRQQYPQYSDLSDQQLADSLHQKFYADMPRDEFNQKIGLNQSSDATQLSRGDAGYLGFKAGINNVSLGTLQPVIENPNSNNFTDVAFNSALGSAAPAAKALLNWVVNNTGIKQKSQDVAQSNNADLQQAYAAHPSNALTGDIVGSMVGSIPAMALPGFGKTKFVKGITSGLEQGLANGATQYVDPNTDQSRLKNTAQSGAMGTAISTVLGLLGKGFGYGLGKGYNAIKGNIADPAAAEVIKQGEKWNVPVFAADASDNPTIKRITETYEDLPLVNVRKERKAQMDAAQNAAQKMQDQLHQDVINTRFGGEEGTPEFNNAIDQNTKYAKSAKKTLQDMFSSTVDDDWDQIAQTGANVRLLKQKMLADKQYSKVKNLADQFGNIDTSDLVTSINSLLGDLDERVLKNKPVIAKLNEIKSGLFEAPEPQPASNILDNYGNPMIPAAAPKMTLRPINFSQMHDLRSDIGDEIDKFYTGENAAIGKKGVGYLQDLKNQIDNKMERFATSKSNELSSLWHNADNNYKTNIAPYKDPALAKAMKDADPETIYQKFVKTTTKTGRATRFYNALDDKGKAAVRYGMFTDAMQKAYDPNTKMFSPAILDSEMKKRAGAYGVFFRGDQKAEMDGFLNLMRHVERSKIAISKPETGVKAAPYIVGGGIGAAAYHSTKDAFLGLLGAAGIKQLMISPAGRRILLASSKFPPGSQQLEKLMSQANAIMQKGSIAAGSASASANNAGLYRKPMMDGSQNAR